MVGRRILQCKRFGRWADRELGRVKTNFQGEVDPYGFQVSFIMGVAINVPLGRAKKKKTNKQTNAGMERGSQVDKGEKIR